MHFYGYDGLFRNAIDSTEKFSMSEEINLIATAQNSAVLEKQNHTITVKDLEDYIDVSQAKVFKENNIITIIFYDSGRKYTLDNTGLVSYIGIQNIQKLNIGEEVAATLSDGTEVVITEENVDEYIGSPVTNYKTLGQTEQLQIGANVYTLSTTYKLYYIDFDNKYGDGKGTIYLKADYIPNQYPCQTDGNIETSKIRNFNPSMYVEGLETPDINSKKMKAAIWLLDTEKWAGLIDSSVDTDIADKINYIVGAPSVELMFDSYNTCYGLKGETPKKATGSERVKLFYKYSNKLGYQVAPNGENSKEYGSYLANNSIKSDPEIDYMYYPGSTTYAYYLASPSAKSNNYSIMRVLGNNGGFASYTPSETSNNCFCPIISLSPDCTLNLGNNN